VLRARASEEEAEPEGHGQQGMTWNFRGWGGDPREVQLQNPPRKCWLKNQPSLPLKED